MLENPLSFPMFAIRRVARARDVRLTAARDLRFISRVDLPASPRIGIALAVGAPRDRHRSGRRRASARPAGPAVPRAARFAGRVFPAAARRHKRRRLPRSPQVTSAPATGRRRGLVSFQYHTFLAMAAVLIADDAYLFMVAWEAMALASFSS